MEACLEGGGGHRVGRSTGGVVVVGVVVCVAAVVSTLKPYQPPGCDKSQQRIVYRKQAG